MATERGERAPNATLPARSPTSQALWTFSRGSSAAARSHLSAPLAPTSVPASVPSSPASGPAPGPQHRQTLLALVAFAIAAACLFARLGALPLIQPDEGRNAEVAREMMASGAWLIPTYDGVPYLDKPAPYFRVVALSFALLGQSELAARLPSALAGLALLTLVYAFCRGTYGGAPAALAVIVIGTAPLYIAFSRLVILDMLLALAMTAAILAGHLAEERSGSMRARWYLASAGAAAVATLIKGPVGVIVPALVLLTAARLDGRRGAARRLFAPANVMLFLGLVLPWFLAVVHRYPDFAYYGLVRESLARFATPAFRRTAPVYYYLPVIAAVFFPWSVLLPEAAVAAWRARRQWTRADRLFVAWTVVVVLFFSISESKLPGYVLTAIVALGVLVARVLAASLARPHGRAARIVRHGVLLLAAGSATAAGLAAVEIHSPGTIQHLFHARPSELDPLEPAFPPLLATLVTLALVGTLVARRGAPRPVVATFLLVPLSLLTVMFGGARQYAEAHSARRLAERLGTLASGAEIGCLQCFPPGLPFYLGRPVAIVSQDGHETTSNYVVYALTRAPRWPAVIVPLAERDRWLASSTRPVFLLASESGRATLDSLAARTGSRARPVVAGWWGALVTPEGQ